MLTLPCCSRLPQAGRCAGCGRYRGDLQRGRPAWHSGLPGRASAAPYCPDCREYVGRTYDGAGEPGWVSEDDGLLPALLNVFCSVPFEPATMLLESQWNRSRHADLPYMTAADLLAEEQRIKLRALYDSAPPVWLGERLAAVRRELRRRGR
jgi:hypothetical protein